LEKAAEASSVENSPANFLLAFLPGRNKMRKQTANELARIVWDEIEWDRGIKTFYDIFTNLAIKHYQRVGRDAQKRIQAIESFKRGGYARFTFAR
jgi:hypothetical protein